VITVGIVPTPTVGIMLRNLNCVGGVVITASHNPIEYNGIKLLLDNGIAPPPAQAQEIKDRYLQKQLSPVDSKSCGKVFPNDQANETHISKVLELVNVENIKSKKFKVVLDSVNGAGGPVTKDLLTRLGCEVVAVNNEPTGLFAHTPEPTRENLTDLCGLVKQHNADLGLAQDPDADRLAIVDEKGNYIGEEYTLALAAKYILNKTPGNAAANLSTSRMIDDIAAEKGCSVIRTAVGEANVAGAMIENNCVIGGEGNGGVIDLRVGPIRDSLVGASFVLDLLAETGKTISQLTEEIGGYDVIKEKFNLDAEAAQKLINAAKQQFIDAKINTTDGCRFDFDKGWIHLRCSNTEPVMRMIIEASDRQTADEFAGVVRKLINDVTG